MIIKTGIKLSIVYFTLLLTGCDLFNNDDISSICENSPELCSDLHRIMDCRFKRTTVIRARYYNKIEPTEVHKHELLKELDEYESCLELTLFMQFTRNKIRKQQRVENFLTTQAIIQELIKESKGTKDPTLAYYLWTHYQDKQAREVFLTAAEDEQTKNPRLLFKLATINAKSNSQKALKHYYKALHLSTSIEEIPPSVFANIMTIYYQSKKFKEAYIWALITEKQDEQDQFPINLEFILKNGSLSGDYLINNVKELKEIAEIYHEALEDGVFKESVPLLK